MATRHIITMLEKLQVETENTISHLNVSLSDRFLSQSTAIHENNCYHTIGEWYKIISYSNKMISFGNMPSMTHIVKPSKTRSSYKTRPSNIRIIGSKTRKTVYCFYTKYAIS